MQLIPHRPPAKKVGLTTLDFAGARPTECKVNAAVLVQPVHFIEELRDLLHLVDHHLANGGASRELGPEEIGVLQVAAVLLSLEQIDPQGVRIRCLQ